MASISDNAGFFMSAKRYLQRRRYKRLDDFNGGRKRLRKVKLRGHKGRLVWKLKFVTKLKLRSIQTSVRVSSKSWLSKMRDAYVNMMFSIGQFRIKQSSKKMGVENLNDKMIVEIYKSLGIQVQVLPNQNSTKSMSQSNLLTLMV